MEHSTLDWGELLAAAFRANDPRATITHDEGFRRTRIEGSFDLAQVVSIFRILQFEADIASIDEAGPDQDDLMEKIRQMARPMK